MVNSEKKSHSIIIENRENAIISGVNDVFDFDDKSVYMATLHGSVLLKGAKLHIVKLSLESGDVVVEGVIDSITYTKQHLAKDENILTRIFK